MEIERHNQVKWKGVVIFKQSRVRREGGFRDSPLCVCRLRKPGQSCSFYFRSTFKADVDPPDVPPGDPPYVPPGVPPDLR